VVIVSATLPTEVLEITQKFMTDPIRVLVKRDELTLEVGCVRDFVSVRLFFHAWVREIVPVCLCVHIYVHACVCMVLANPSGLPSSPSLPSYTQPRGYKH